MLSTCEYNVSYAHEVVNASSMYHIHVTSGYLYVQLLLRHVEHSSRLLHAVTFCHRFSNYGFSARMNMSLNHFFILLVSAKKVNAAATRHFLAWTFSEWSCSMGKGRLFAFLMKSCAIIPRRMKQYENQSANNHSGQCPNKQSIFMLHALGKTGEEGGGDFAFQIEGISLGFSSIWSAQAWCS